MATLRAMNLMPPRKSRLEQYLGWIALVLMMGGCLLVMRPFISAVLWAVLLCFSTWPLYRRILRGIGEKRRTLAALMMTLLIAIFLLLPFVIIGSTLADNVQAFAAATKQWIANEPSTPPEWLEKVPVAGHAVSEYWQTLATDSARLWKDAQRFIEPVSAWLLQVGLVLGGGLMELALSVFIAFFLFRDGVAMSERLGNAVEQLDGVRGRHLLDVAGKTVRGVVHGILGTAVVQAVMAGIGFMVAGVPGASLLALLTFFMSVVPMGPPLIWIPATLWLFNQDQTGWAIFMLVWGVGVSSIDNFVKPWLISQGARLPFLLIFFGVLGGMFTFGFIGVFLGPTLLAVGFRIVKEWETVRKPKSASEQPDVVQVV